VAIEARTATVWNASLAVDLLCETFGSLTREQALAAVDRLRSLQGELTELLCRRVDAARAAGLGPAQAESLAQAMACLLWSLNLSAQGGEERLTAIAEVVSAVARVDVGSDPGRVS
jgi:hypothetical protein